MFWLSQLCVTNEGVSHTESKQKLCVTENSTDNTLRQRRTVLLLGSK